jgi:hypothetical protein
MHSPGTILDSTGTPYPTAPTFEISNYEGATIGCLGTWGMDIGGPTKSLYSSLTTLRGRARYAYRNNPLYWNDAEHPGESFLTNSENRKIAIPAEDILQSILPSLGKSLGSCCCTQSCYHHYFHQRISGKSKTFSTCRMAAGRIRLCGSGKRSHSRCPRCASRFQFPHCHCL